jgi:hypothetical protein
MKRIFLAILLLVASIGYSQIAVETDYYGAGLVYSIGSLTVDSANATIKLTDYFDGTPIDNQTIYFTYDFVTAGNTADSILVILQGFTPAGNSTGMVVNCDTLFLVGSTASSVKQVSLSLSGYAPMYRFRIRAYNGAAGVDPNAATGTVKFGIYAKLTDPVYKLLKSWY